MRPSHYTTIVDLVPSSSSTNIQTTGDIVTLPYNDELLIEQSYSSAVENVNPFNVFTFTGQVELYPESDNWVDTKSLSPLKLPVIEGNFLTTVRSITQIKQFCSNSMEFLENYLDWNERIYKCWWMEKNKQTS